MRIRIQFCQIPYPDADLDPDPGLYTVNLLRRLFLSNFFSHTLIDVILSTNMLNRLRSG
jgi:hypothetical protein